MSLILVTNKRGGTARVHLGGFVGLLLVLVLGLLITGSVYVGSWLERDNVAPDSMVRVLQTELAVQKHDLAAVTQSAEENMNALAMRLGQLKAHIVRLDALGQRLIDKAELDKGEFDFESPPAVGGPANAAGERGKAMSVPDFLTELDNLSGQVEHRSLQLGVLETMLMNRELQDEVYPAGRPVKRGWVSSYYGYRTDPFNGRIAHHDGIDIAGKHGSDIISVAAGVVTWSGKRYGYGNLVEINHGNGYVTRYGHCEKVLVKVGQMVKKGEEVAEMGSSGRSTGPHVHFEVIKNGRVVDPIRYVRASR
ncbi:MAG: M23 family metallopeptidase [Gammaproteobacteria bacterium]|nr:M23 family metallopeptidase [Gammaproteobacteria bacterium]